MPRTRHGDFIWYELMTSDADAAQKFYGGLTGWTFRDGGQPDMDYRLFSMNASDVGGLMPLSADMIEGGARPLWTGYIAVDDVDATAAQVKVKGGEVLLGPLDIPDVGRFAFVKDPHGAPFYIMRGNSDEASTAFAATTPKDGHCAWNELVSDDLDAAAAFYRDLFGWVEADSLDLGEMGPYRMYRNGAGRDFMFGAITGKPPQMPASLWAYYFRVPDIDAAAQYVEENGGQIINRPMEIPGGEYVLQAIDPQGAMFSLLGKRVSG
ncbi:VOC family protein [Sphingomicrobium flavum]|uniref:VOC family protein n=1 Tax=Sphingomicrobium flavum TaxID=1229164 RepID=UPI0021AD5714|nr:VOC family protein [Sphingomicrobium flavum]